VPTILDSFYKTAVESDTYRKYASCQRTKIMQFKEEQVLVDSDLPRRSFLLTLTEGECVH
jgi:hypothetical protein